MDRADVLCMMRLKNEGRWIRRSLERTWQVCQAVVIFDDHSTDNTFEEAVASLGEPWPSDSPLWTATSQQRQQAGGVSIITAVDGQQRELHWLTSPFQETVEEVRDKNHLWEYVVNKLTFRAVLCLDGDEMLSKSALRAFPSALHRLEQGGASVIIMPFIYLWNEERQRRVDGVYSDIRHARLFTIDRAPDYRQTRFFSHGRAGFHCGSIPDRLNIRQHDMPEMTVIHFGYLEESIRQRKLEFYTRLDPGNEGEGYYKHVVGLPNHLAPGPVRLVEYEDK